LGTVSGVRLTKPGARVLIVSEIGLLVYYKLSKFV